MSFCDGFPETVFLFSLSDFWGYLFERFYDRMISGSDLRMTVRQVLSAFRIRFDPEENKNLTEERGFFMKNLIVGQSGGPTAVINSSLYGVIQEALPTAKKLAMFTA